MRCNICRNDVPQFDKQSKIHESISKDNEGNIHTHGNLHAKEDVKELLENAANELGIDLAGPKASTLPAEVVFHNRQRIGDMLVFTCAIRDFKAAFPQVRVNVISTAGHIWDNNPNVDRSLVPNEANTVKVGPSKLTNASNRLQLHFSEAFRISIEDALGVKIPQGESKPDIYLTQEEYDADPIFGHPYWIISTTGEKGWGTKMYPHSKWQAVVDQNPDLIFVQIGTKEDNAPRLQGTNVIDFVGKTQSKEAGIRDLFKLFLNAEGSIGLVSFHMHLSAAFGKPCVVIAGGREPVHFTRYPGHAYLSTDGMLPCATKACWHCSIDACTNLVMKSKYPDNKIGTDELEKVPKCVDIIGASDITHAIRGYYSGGRLVKGQRIAKPKLKNVVPTPVKTLAQKASNTGEVIPDLPWKEFTWGGGSLTWRDWAFIKATIEKYNVVGVLEFGAGLSTLLLNSLLPNEVLTLETKLGWLEKINKLDPYAAIALWDGETPPLPIAKYDMAFVDGPAGDFSRETSTRFAADRAQIVIIHDAGREWARKYQEQYLAPGFEGPFKGGHRCHLWVKKDLQKPPEWEHELSDGSVVPKIKIALPAPSRTHAQAILAPLPTKFIKIVSTARGWGGCARSVTTITKMLLKGGHRVEFIPFRNSVTSAEWRAVLKSDLQKVTVTEHFGTIKEPCDVLLVYADDYIWDFDRPAIAEAFSEVGADRKIMMLNYRRGKVGEIPWTKNWDKYMFLNRDQEAELCNVLRQSKTIITKVLPPCTDLEPFFGVQPDYGGALRLVRHSSQGNTKFAKDFGSEIYQMRLAQNCHIHLLPGPDFIEPTEYLTKHPRTDKPEVIAQFLAKGNCFWYSLPQGYMDMGPRVILEAMAAGLPVLADNWGGAVDRVSCASGWLTDTKIEQAQLLPGMTEEVLRRKGEAARQRAYDEFSPEAWLREILQ